MLYMILPHYVFALSPSFVPQEIINDHNHWSIVQVPQHYAPGPVIKQGIKHYAHSFTLAKNTTECKVSQFEQRYIRPPGISAATYLSDGKKLNVTIWLSHPLLQPPSNASYLYRPPYKEIRWLGMGYDISIHIHSAYGTPNYGLQIEWNLQNGTWTKSLLERSPLGNVKFLNNNDYRIPIGKQYLDLSFDLQPLNYPNLYDIVFYTHDEYVKNGYLCRMINMASRVYVPPPEFSITTLPNTINLRPGDEANVELKLKSNINIRSHAFLSVNKSNDIQTSIIPNETFLPPNGISTPTLTIKALNDAKPHPYTLPIIANFSIPTEAKSMTTTEAHTLTSEIARSSDTTFTNQVSNLTLVVQPPYTLSEQLTNFVTSWITPISGLWSFLAGVAAVATPLIIRKKTKKQNEN
jgi:hypothetical protein